MITIFKLTHPIADNVTTRPKDVLAAKQFLYDLGFYEPPEWGITQYPDHALINAIRDFQRANGLRVDGVMKPGGESEDAIQQVHAAARRLQGLGRHGDTLLAHITPEEAELEVNTVMLKKFEQELIKLEREVKELKAQEEIAQRAYEECMGN